MFGMGMPEILLILALALIVIGPKKLPEIAKAMGRAMGEFKKATNDLKNSINIDEPIDITPESKASPYPLETIDPSETKSINEGNVDDNRENDGAEPESPEEKKENE